MQTTWPGKENMEKEAATPWRNSCNLLSLYTHWTFLFKQAIQGKYSSFTLSRQYWCMWSILASFHSFKDDDDSAVDLASYFDLPFCKSRLLASQILNLQIGWEQQTVLFSLLRFQGLLFQNFCCISTGKSMWSRDFQLLLPS